MLAREVAQRVSSVLTDRLDEAGFAMIAVGGAGINVLRELSPDLPLRRIALDTDEGFLDMCQSDEQLNLGRPLLDGLGTGGETDLGRSAALIHGPDIAKLLRDEILLLAAGLGRGTGTGAAPVVASIAKEKGLPVLAFLIWPFKDERISTKARKGLNDIRPNCDAILVLDNSRALEVAGIESHWEAASLVNSMMARMVERFVERISEAFPFAVEDEIADLVGGLPAAQEGLPLKTAELSFEPSAFEPIAMDSRGMIQLK